MDIFKKTYIFQELLIWSIWFQVYLDPEDIEVLDNAFFGQFNGVAVSKAGWLVGRSYEHFG